AGEFHVSDETADISIPALTLLNPLAPEIVLRKESSRAEQVVKAIAKAHTKRISQAAYKDGDWAVEMRGKWYYYADGRMLSEELRDKADSYGAQPFYNYPEELPEWQPPAPENAARYAVMAKQRGTGGSARRSQVFYDDLWRIHNRAEAWQRQKTINFLGRKVLIHHAILEELSLVEQKINEAAAEDPQARQWISKLETISTWNWRDIADTHTRSNHAYGIAIDLLPSSKNRQETYWLWTAQKNIDWWDVPFSKRMTPPTAIIKAFEAYGFVWGGKWLFYDTMHFEYRPEILLLNGIPLRGEY
ncbi:MAG: M15 family metallopeptidase, partial [Spirochaetaceae bacterium]|nr:M15 family metallopeptidase [Spirochaetaceae bacterium]